MPTYQWLLVCLGNPGKDYEDTRHNIGFMTADRLSSREGRKHLHEVSVVPVLGLLDAPRHQAQSGVHRPVHRLLVRP